MFLTAIWRTWVLMPVIHDTGELDRVLVQPGPPVTAGPGDGGGLPL
jgi:hypothetical protein